MSLRIMKGFFFNLVFCMETNSVLLAVCGWMDAHLHAWMCLVNIKAWPGQSIFWGCFGLDAYSVWISDAAPTTFSLESQKLSIQVLHVSTSPWELSQKFQLTLTTHQWLGMPRRWMLCWHPLPLISTVVFLLIWTRSCPSEESQSCAFLC